MYPTLIHIYGPLAIHSYGVMIALGICVFTICVMNDHRRKKLVTEDQFVSLLIRGIIAATVGGKVLFALMNSDTFTHPFELLQFWHGGFSILGSLIAVICVIPFYVRRFNIALAPFLDLIALYAPLLQSIARLGCLFAGCCFGKASNTLFSMAVADDYGNLIYRHPTQLYSSAALFIIFLVLYLFIQRRTKKNGQLALWYLILATTERGLIDIFRSEQQFGTSFPFSWFSINQCIAFTIGAGACILLLFTHFFDRKQQRYESIQFH
jgi:phosphatidylglycerol:prolipoprotein diacylglycerol transferase